MTPANTPSSDPADEARPPANGTLSRTLFNDVRVKAEAPGEWLDSAAPGLSGVVKQRLRP